MREVRVESFVSSRSELIVGILEIETRRGKKTDERKTNGESRMNENIEEELVQCKKIKVNKVISNIFMVSKEFLRNRFFEIC